MKIGKDINEAADLLKKGGVVGIPTETVYGLAGNAFNQDAVLKIFEAKNRPTFNPLIVHTNSIDRAKSFVNDFPEKAVALAERFWPGPLTLLLPKSDKIDDVVTSGSDLVAVRIPNHKLTLELLSSLDFPLCAPSANKFGALSPTEPEAVKEQLDNDVQFVLDGGESNVGIESTIVGFEEGIPVVYRTGGLSVEDIEGVIGEVTVNKKSHEKPKTSGMMKSHYAPDKPFYVGDLSTLLLEHSDKRVAVLSFEESYPEHLNLILSESGDVREAARNLFKYMRKLDHEDVEVILAEYIPNEGLGRGVNDRLKRADHRNK